MRKKLILLLTMLFILTACGNAKVNKGINKQLLMNFRKTTWGMSPDEVKEKEKKLELIYEQENELDFSSVNYENHKADLFYYFDSDAKLYAASYVFDGSNLVAEADDEEAFMEMVAVLTRKFKSRLGALDILNADNLSGYEQSSRVPEAGVDSLGWMFPNCKIIMNIDYKEEIISVDYESIDMNIQVE